LTAHHWLVCKAVGRLTALQFLVCKCNHNFRGKVSSEQQSGQSSAIRDYTLCYSPIYNIGSAVIVQMQPRCWHDLLASPVSVLFYQQSQIMIYEWWNLVVGMCSKIRVWITASIFICRINRTNGTVTMGKIK